MIIGIPKEVKDQEFRVGLTPGGVSELTRRGHTVWLEVNAGEGSGFTNDAYLEAGAYIASTKEELFHHANLVIKVKDPLVEECQYFQPKHTLFAYLHLAADRNVTEALLATGCMAIAYETTEDEKGGLSILQPMSQIAGRMAIQIGAHYLEREQGGQGILLGGVPGVPPGHVVILGAGTVGSAAARIAVGLGAQVTVISLDLEQLRQLDDRYQGRIATLYSTQDAIDRVVPSADLLVGAVMVRGARTPQLVSRRLVALMKARSVIVDVAVDQGGCVETIRPTTHSDPIYSVEEILHYGVTNIPGIVPKTSTVALTHATLPFIVQLADAGVESALSRSPGLSRGLNVKQGCITYKAVADAHGLTFQPLTKVVGH